VKILINAISAKQGGIVTYTQNMARSLERRGVDFRIAVPPALGHLPRSIVLAASDYNPFRRFIWEQTAWRRHVARWNPDILFSSANYALFGYRSKQVLLVREGGLFDPFYMSMISPEQGTWLVLLRYLRRKLILYSVARSTITVVPSDTLRQLLIYHDLENEKRCLTLRYGTLVEAFDTVPRRAWRADGVLKILYVGVYYPHKVPGDLVLAAEQLSARGIPCRVRLTMDEAQIAATSGALWDLFHVRRGIAEGLVELGPIPYAQLPAAYAAHDLLAFPSISETFGHPLVEALSAHIPIVAADTAINREILGDCGRYYTPLRPEEMAEAIRKLDSDPASREQLARDGRRRAEEMFDWDRYVDRLLATFEDIMRNPPA
jgi:glycosyltransferase involved in cell wall biosynthesis